MEDPSEEYWEIEDYSQPYEQTDGKLGWIWRKGLNIGKKIVVTGVVISSAPFVLPPLVALSTIGVAFSVPAGFVIVTYVCTDKLMNCLLPMPSPPPSLENGTMPFDEAEYMFYEDDVDKGYQKDEDLETEEKGSEEDTGKGLEMRFDLVEEGNYEIDYSLMPVCKDEVDRTRKVNEIVEEIYEEDVDERIHDRKKPLDADAITEILEGIRQAEDEIAFFEGEGNDEMPTTGSLQAVVVSAEVDGENDDSVENVLEELSFLGPQTVKEENGHTENFTEVNEDEMRRETTRLLEEMRDEGIDHEKMQENEEKVKILMKEYENKGNNSLFVIPEEVKPAEDVAETDQKASEREVQGDEGLITESEPKPVAEEQKLVVQVKTSDDHMTTDVRQGAGSDRKTGTLALSDVDATEMADESGFGLIDHGTRAPYQVAESVDKRSKAEELSSKNAVDVNVEYHEVTIESTIPVLKNARTALDQGTTASSNKVSINEEKIWDQIHAMRTIVGYKVAPHTSCLEELKALFIFTGVEPPVSSKDPADLVDMNEKLHFLMSVIGVK